MRMNRTAMFLSAVLLGITPALSMATPAIAQEVSPSRVLTVTGRGERLVPTANARVQLGIAIEAKTAQEVQAEIAQRTSQVIARLKQMNVERLQTTGISLSPKYEYIQNRQQQVGFTGQTSLSFVTSIDRAGTTLDAAVAAGANRVDQISFTATEDVIRAARSASLQDATKDAQEQANAVLSSLNLTAKSIRAIRIGDATPVLYPLTNRVLEQNANFAATMPIVGGDQKVQSTVALEITY